MLIRHLEFFVTLAEERHFGRAADLCSVTQPAFSLAIRKLEEDLGSKLVIRGHRFAGLTAEGERALDWGRRILSDYGSLRDDLTGRRKGGLTGRLRLGVVPSALPAVPAITARFEARNPMARIAICALSAEAISRGIETMALDGGLVWQDAARGGAAENVVDVLPLRRESLLFACHRDHPFAPLGSISWSDALTQPLCLTDDILHDLSAGQAIGAAAETDEDGPAGPVASSRGRAVPRRGGAGRGGRPPWQNAGVRASVTCSTLDGVLAHLRAALWCSLVPQGFAALLSAQDEIVLREMTGTLPARSLGLVLPRDDTLSPMARALRDCVLALAQESGPDAAPEAGQT